MNKLLIGLGVLILLVLLVAVAAPFLVPIETVKTRLAAGVKAATGRDLTIAGPIKLTLLPSPAIEASDVALANLPGASTPEMARLGKIEVGVKLFPILSGEIAVDRLVLREPSITLEIDKQGHANWMLAAPPPTGVAPGASSAGSPTAAPPTTPAAARNRAPSQLRLGDIRLVDGRILYLDQRSGSRQELTGIDMRLSLPSLDQPLTADGKLTWNGKPVTLSATVAAPRAFLAGKASGIALKLAAEPVSFEIKGSAATAEAAHLEGDVDLAMPSLRAAAAWAGTPLAPGSGLGPLAIKGKVLLGGAKASFSDATLTLDAIKATGEIGFDGSGAKPYLKGKLAVERLDLNPYLAAEKPATAPRPASPKPGAAPGAPPTATAPGWSEEPFDLAGLKAANADLELSTGGIQYRRITIGKGGLTVTLKEGRLTAELARLELYQGSGQGRLVIDAAAPIPTLNVALKLADVQAETLLRDAIDFGRLAGKGAFELELTGRGRSQRELIGALSGKGALYFKDGALKGFNLGAMGRNLATAFSEAQSGLTGAAAPSQPQTEFTELSATYTVANGILTNKDLTVKSALLRADGAGTIDLPRRTVDFRIMPRFSGGGEALGGRVDLSAVTVPVLIQGPFDHITYKPDLAGAVKQQLGDPAKIIDMAKPGAGRGGAKPTDLLRHALGKGKKN